MTDMRCGSPSLAALLEPEIQSYFNLVAAIEQDINNYINYF